MAYLMSSEQRFKAPQSRSDGSNPQLGNTKVTPKVVHNIRLKMHLYSRTFLFIQHADTSFRNKTAFLHIISILFKCLKPTWN
jgi:hypothetical protein